MTRNRAGLLSTLALVALAVAARWASVEPVLEYRVDAIVNGDWWRIATSHLAHWSTEHLAWDCLTLLVLGVAFDRVAGDEPWRVIGTIAGAAMAIPLVLFAWQPELAIYRGLSGIASALFVLVGVIALSRSASPVERAVVGLALLGFVVKTVVEVATGSALFVQDFGGDVVPVPLAHAVGAMAGLGFGVRRESAAFTAPLPRRTPHERGST